VPVLEIGVLALGNKVLVGPHLSGPLQRKASARFGVRSKVRASHQFFRAAVAPNAPHSWRCVFAKNHKPAESLASDVNKLHASIVA
jgi:hypothetical protein